MCFPCACFTPEDAKKRQPFLRTQMVAKLALTKPLLLLGLMKSFCEFLIPGKTSLDKLLEYPELPHCNAHNSYEYESDAMRKSLLYLHSWAISLRTTGTVYVSSTFKTLANQAQKQKASFGKRQWQCGSQWVILLINDKSFRFQQGGFFIKVLLEKPKMTPIYLN